MRICLLSVIGFFFYLTAFAFDGKRSVEVTDILTADELDLSETPIGIIPGAGLFALYSNRLVSIEPDSTMRRVDIDIPEDVVIDEFIFAGKTLVFKNDDSLVWTSSSMGFDAVTFVDSSYSLYAATDSTVFMCRQGMLIEFNIKSKRPEMSVQSDGLIVNACKLRDGLLLATDRSILSLYEGEWSLLHTHPGPINTAAFMPEGIFIGTDEGLWRIVGDGVVELVAMGTVRKMYNDNSVLYILDGAGNLMSLTFWEN